MYDLNPFINKNGKLTKEFILDTYSEYDIYAFYLGHSFNVGEVFNSPLRVDKTPSFGIFKAKNGSLLFKDLSTGESGNCFKFIQLKEQKKTLQHVLIDIYLKMFLKKVAPSNYIPQHKDKVNISIFKGKWADYDLEYWSKFNITEDILNYYNVYKAYKVYKDDDLIMTHNRLNPIYAYKIFNSYKIYRPLAEKDKKWAGNCSLYDIGGYQQLPEQGDLLIISKALKDVMFWYSLGYSAVCPSSETASIPEHIIDILKSRFKTIIICLDNDTPGINAAKKLSKKHNLPYTHIPTDIEEKDLTDFCSSYGIDRTKILIQNLLSHANKEKNEEENS